MNYLVLYILCGFVSAGVFLETGLNKGYFRSANVNMALAATFCVFLFWPVVFVGALVNAIRN